MTFFRFLFTSLGVVSAVGSIHAAPLVELFHERLRSVVAVEFFVQGEIERHPVGVQGTVIDDEGTIILQPASILPGLAPDQLIDFKVYRPGSAEGFSAVYLGQDAYTGWHFIRAEEKIRPLVTPITRYAAAREPGLSDELWGIGLRNKDEDFMPYFLSSRVALVTRLPQKIAILGADVAGPGLPVFTQTGEFAGLAQASFGQNFLLFSHQHDGNPILLVNVEESSVVLLAGEVLPHLARRPATVTGRPIAWLGAYGLQPLDAEVAKLLKLENQAGVVLSDLLPDSPGARAGLQDRDIVVALDGEALPRLKPANVMAAWLSQEILRRRPGDTLTFTVNRGGETRTVPVTLGDEPKLEREAARQYFSRLGCTVREFLVADGIAQRTPPGERSGVMVGFVKPGSPVATAGLQSEDWIREIDGTAITSYDQALAQLNKIDGDEHRPEFILLVSRGGETAVLRVKLN